MALAISALSARPPIWTGLFTITCSARAIAAATRLPVMVYNVPGRTACNMEPETLVRLVEAAPNVVAVKEASGNLDQIGEIRRRLPRPFRVYAGDDSFTLPVLAIGGDGVVSVASHLVARSAYRTGGVHADLLFDDLDEQLSEEPDMPRSHPRPDPDREDAAPKDGPEDGHTPGGG